MLSTSLQNPTMLWNDYSGQPKEHIQGHSSMTVLWNTKRKRKHGSSDKSSMSSLKLGVDCAAGRQAAETVESVERSLPP